MISRVSVAVIGSTWELCHRTAPIFFCMKTLTKYVTFSIAVLIIYAVVELILSDRTGLTHDTLTTCVFAFFGTEIGSCCLIKIVKTKQPKQDSQTESNPDDIEITDFESIMRETTQGGGEG